MARNLTRVWPLLVLAFASEVWALGLGDIRLSSALNQPLRAEIELISATPEELDSLRVLLASSETFARYGLDRPLLLQGVDFKVIRSGGIDGNVIRVRSQDPVTEPFIIFLVEATWSRGRLLREYTLLLDPPTFAPPPVAESATAVTAPQQTTQADIAVDASAYCSPLQRLSQDTDSIGLCSCRESISRSLEAAASTAMSSG